MSASAREVAEDIKLLLADSRRVPRFDQPVMEALTALAKAVRDEADPAVLVPPLHLIDHVIEEQSSAIRRRCELILGNLQEAFRDYSRLEDDDGDWSVPWCGQGRKASSMRAADGCKSTTCRRPAIKSLCQSLSQMGVGFIELRRRRYRFAALSWVRQRVDEAYGSDETTTPPLAPTEPGQEGLGYRELVAALRGPLLGLQKRCPCAALQHAALGNLLRQRDKSAIKLAERVFGAATNVRLEGVYRHMLLGVSAPPAAHPDFSGWDDFPLVAAEYGKVVGLEPDFVTKALHDTVHHIRVSK